MPTAAGSLKHAAPAAASGAPWLRQSSPWAVVPLIWSPSGDEGRAIKFSSWISQLTASGSVCEVQLPPTRADDYFLHRPERGGPVLIYEKATKSLVFNVPILSPNDGVTNAPPFELHEVGSAAFQLKALKCISAGARCHPCLETRRWFMVVEDDVVPMLPPARMATLLPAAIQALRTDGQHVNKLQLALKLGAKCGDCNAAMNKRIWANHETVCLRSCYDAHDARAFIIRRDLALQTLEALDISASGERTNSVCENPWHSKSHTCGSDPALFRYIFSRCKVGHERTKSSCQGAALGHREGRRPGIFFHNSTAPRAPAPGLLRYPIFVDRQDVRNFSLREVYQAPELQSPSLVGQAVRSLFGIFSGRP